MDYLTRRKFVFGSAGLLTASYLPWTVAWGAEILGVRMWPSPEYTRLTIEHDAPMKFRYFMLRTQHPIRLAVDVEGMTLTEKFKRAVQKVNPRDPYIESIRVGQFDPKTVRLTISFKTDVDPQVFSLKPAGEYKYRLVFDIYPAVQKDPLMAKIRKEETEPDAIGRLLAQIAEGQRRMEKNRQETEKDAIGDLLAGIQSGQLAPKKPDMKGIVDKPSDKKAPASKTTPPATTAPTPSKAPIAKVDAGKKTTSTAKTPAKSAPKPRTLVIAIDPGHGGEDPGAIGKRYKTREKDVVLSISRILARSLNSIPGIKTVLTRDSDYFVPLNRRVQKARAAKADFFVSIHADAWIRPDAKGSSLFTLSSKGQDSSANSWLAKNQNNADLIGGVNVSKHDREVAQILLDMSFTAQVSESIVYGGRILTQMAKVNTLHRAQVEHANFAVLKSPDIPSVLVETAFLSNPEEEKKLRTAAFQKKVAHAIGNGILIGFGKKPVLA